MYRWSKIAQYLPGRTDNEIKNYWRTRVQKQAKQLKCDVNSKQFQDAMRYVWIPRLIERIQAGRPDSSPTAQPATKSTDSCFENNTGLGPWGSNWVDPNSMPDISGTSSDTSEAQLSSISDPNPSSGSPTENGSGTSCQYGSDIQGYGQNDIWSSGGDSLENWWSEEDLRFLETALQWSLNVK